MLDLGGVGLTTAERSEADPLVIAGGSIVLNPEPVADFVDAVVLGEGEDVVLRDQRRPRVARLAPPDRARGRRRRGEWRRGVDRTHRPARPGPHPAACTCRRYTGPLYLADGRFDRTGAASTRPPRPRSPLASPPTSRPTSAAFASSSPTSPSSSTAPSSRSCAAAPAAAASARPACSPGRCASARRTWPSPPPRRSCDATGYEEIGLTSLSTADYTYVREVATELHRRRPGDDPVAAEHARRRLHRRAGRRHRSGRPARRLHLRARGGQPAAARRHQQGRRATRRSSAAPSWPSVAAGAR